MEKEYTKSEELPPPAGLPSEEPPPYSSVTLFGLEKLASLERIEIRQKDVVTEHGEVIFNLKREMTGSGFQFDFYDLLGRLAISFRTVSAFISSRLEVYVGGHLVASIRQKFTLPFLPQYTIFDVSNQKLLKIKVPFTTRRDYTLRLLNQQRQDIGFIYKKLQPMADEWFSDSNEFLIGFPLELDVRYKAAVIALPLLIIQTANLARRHI